MPTQQPRVNVTVTVEQHALLLELAELQGGSASGFLRQMLDAATPLIRVTVPMLRAASDEMEITRQRANELMRPVFDEMRKTGLVDQPDLLDGNTVARSRPKRVKRSERERARPHRQASAGKS